MVGVASVRNAHALRLNHALAPLLRLVHTEHEERGDIDETCAGERLSRRDRDALPSARPSPSDTRKFDRTYIHAHRRVYKTLATARARQQPDGQEPRVGRNSWVERAFYMKSSFRRKDPLMHMRTKIARIASVLAGLAVGGTSTLAGAQTTAPPPGNQDPNASPPP